MPVKLMFHMKHFNLSALILLGPWIVAPYLQQQYQKSHLTLRNIREFAMDNWYENEPS